MEEVKDSLECDKTRWRARIELADLRRAVREFKTRLVHLMPDRDSIHVEDVADDGLPSASTELQLFAPCIGEETVYLDRQLLDRLIAPLPDGHVEVAYVECGGSPLRIVTSGGAGIEHRVMQASVWFRS